MQQRQGSQDRRDAEEEARPRRSDRSSAPTDERAAAHARRDAGVGRAAAAPAPAPRSAAGSAAGASRARRVRTRRRRARRRWPRSSGAGARGVRARRWFGDITLPSIERLIQDADIRARAASPSPNAIRPSCARTWRPRAPTRTGSRRATIPTHGDRDDRQGVPRRLGRNAAAICAVRAARLQARAPGRLAAGGRAARRVLRSPAQPAPRVRPRQPPAARTTRRRRATSCRCPTSRRWSCRRSAAAS